MPSSSVDLLCLDCQRLLRGQNFIRAWFLAPAQRTHYQMGRMDNFQSQETKTGKIQAKSPEHL